MNKISKKKTVTTSQTAKVSESCIPDNFEIPEFWKDNAALWFHKLEAIFWIKQITLDETKFSYVVSKLDFKSAKLVEDVITSPATAKNKYNAIKLNLINRSSVLNSNGQHSESAKPAALKKGGQGGVRDGLKLKSEVDRKLKAQNQQGAQAPTQSHAQAPTQSHAQAPSQSRTQAPSQSRAQASRQSRALARSQSRAQAPSQSRAQVPRQSRAQVPRQSRAQVPRQSYAEDRNERFARVLSQARTRSRNRSPSSESSEDDDYYDYEDDFSKFFNKHEV